VIVLNHSPVRREFGRDAARAEGWTAGRGPFKIAAPPRSTGEIAIPVTVGATSGGPAVVTAERVIRSVGTAEWMEALVDVKWFKCNDCASLDSGHDSGFVTFGSIFRGPFLLRRVSGVRKNSPITRSTQASRLE